MRSIPIFKHLRIIWGNLAGAEHGGQCGDAQVSGAERRLDRGQTLPTVDAAQRLPLGDHTTTSGREELSQEVHGEVRQIHRHHQNPLVAGFPQRGEDTGEGTAFGPQVFENREFQMTVTMRGTQNRDVANGFPNDSRHTVEHRFTRWMQKQRFVSAPHPAAESTGQDKASDQHEMMVTRPVENRDWNRVESGVYSKRNISFAQCFVLLLSLQMAISAQTTNTKRTVSTVRADYRTGRLIRTTTVVEAKPVEPKAVEPRVIAPVEVGAATKAADAPINDLVEEAAQKHGVDPALVHSVIKAESNYNPVAVSPVGARGLMQLMPATARQLGVHNSFNPKENIEGGVKYLKYLQEKFQDPALALAAYNAGEGAVAKYNNSIPPYRETQDYVVKVARNYRAAKAAELRQNSKKSPPAVAAPVPAAAAAPEPPKAPEYRKLQAYYDADGRLFLRTQ